MQHLFILNKTNTMKNQTNTQEDTEMSPLQWTRERPTTPGWYWWKYKNRKKKKEPRVVYLGKIDIIKASDLKDKQAWFRTDEKW